MASVAAAGMNSAIVVFAFSCILGSPFSQRARCATAYFLIPALATLSGLRLLQPKADLVDTLKFYAAFHQNPTNQVIHAIFVPIIVFTALVWLAYVPVCSRRNADTQSGVIKPLSRARVSPGAVALRRKDERPGQLLAARRHARLGSVVDQHLSRCAPPPHVGTPRRRVPYTARPWRSLAPPDS